MNRPPHRRVDDIAAYNFWAELYCPTRLIKAMIGAGIAAPAARDMPTANALDQCAEALGIDRADEHSFDSHEFPKDVFLDQAYDDDTRRLPATVLNPHSPGSYSTTLDVVE